MVSKATLRHLRVSPQKTRVVVDAIKGKKVNEALATLRFSNRAVSRDLLRLVQSAVANATSGESDVDVDDLYVSRAFVDPGPTLKRIRPRAMGRAFRILKRSCHVTVHLDAQPPRS